MDDLSTKEHRHHHARHPFFAWMVHYIKWWLAFTGLISATSICPFCGTPGCPVGVGFASAMGGVFALFTQSWKDMGRWFAHHVQRLYARLRSM
jgi:hypothetical protein